MKQLFFLPAQHRSRRAWRRGFGVMDLFLVALALGSGSWSGALAAEPRIEPYGTGLEEVNRFVAKGDQVYDTKTRLTWRRCGAGQKWDGQTCAGKLVSYVCHPDIKTIPSIQGLEDKVWRAPNQEELETLIDHTTVGHPAIDQQAFPNVRDPYGNSSVSFQSSTVSRRAENGRVLAVRLVDFYDGSTDGQICGGYVRLVKRTTGN